MYDITPVQNSPSASTMPSTVLDMYGITPVQKEEIETLLEELGIYV